MTDKQAIRIAMKLRRVTTTKLAEMCGLKYRQYVNQSLSDRTNSMTVERLVMFADKLGYELLLVDKKLRLPDMYIDMKEEDLS